MATAKRGRKGVLLPSAPFVFCFATLPYRGAVLPCRIAVPDGALASLWKNAPALALSAGWPVSLEKSRPLHYDSPRIL